MKKLFGPDFLRRLERVRIHFLRGREERGGAHPSALQAGEGLEFQDYRGYAAGDDPRYIDWNALARLDRVFLKRFRREEGASVVLIVDLSASMAFGEVPKEELARRLAGGLGVVALASGASVRLLVAGETLVEHRLEGKGSGLALLRALADAKVGGDASSLEEAFRRLAQAERRQELFLFTDAWFAKSAEELFQRLGALREKSWVSFVQILSAEERSPSWSGGFRLRDAESGEAMDLEIDEEIALRYRKALDQFLASVEHFCRERGISFDRAGSEQPFDESLIRILQ